MKILITGAAGFLGSYLVEHFLAQGDTVIGVDNLLGGTLDNLNFIIPQEMIDRMGDVHHNPDVPFRLEQGNFSFENADCRNWEAMDSIMQFSSPDIVYHCAATAHEGLSVFSPSFITKNIFEASVSVVSAAIANKVKRFVFMSSMARYGDGFGFDPPFSEKLPIPNPVDPYGIAKLASENILRVLSEVHDMEYIVAIPHNIIGVRQNYTDPYRNVASIMMNRVKLGLPINVYGDGKQIRSFSPIEDCLDCLIKLATIDYEIVKTEFGLNHCINIGPDHNPISVNTLVDKILWIARNHTGVHHYQDRPLEVKHATCSSDLARKLLNYKEIKSLDETLEEMWNAIPEGGKPFVYEYPVEIVTEKTPKPFLRNN